MAITQQISPITPLSDFLSPDRLAEVDNLVEFEIPRLTVELQNAINQTNNTYASINNSETKALEYKNSAFDYRNQAEDIRDDTELIRVATNNIKLDTIQIKNEATAIRDETQYIADNVTASLPLGTVSDATISTTTVYSSQKVEDILFDLKLGLPI